MIAMAPRAAGSVGHVPHAGGSCGAFIRGYYLAGNRGARLPHAQQTRTWVAILLHACMHRSSATRIYIWVRTLAVSCLYKRQAAAIGRLSSIDLVLDCMGSIRSIHLYGKRYRRIFFTIEYEGVIVISIRLSRRELARRLGKASTSCAAHGRTKHEPARIRQDC